MTKQRKSLLSLVVVGLVLVAGSAFSSDSWRDESLPMADDAKPLYQWTGWPPPGNMWLGGKCRKVRIPETRTPAEIRADLEAEYQERLREVDLREYSRGSWLVTVGLLIVSVAVALHCMTSVPQIKQGAWGLGLLGVGVSVAGFVQKKTVEFDTELFWMIGILAGMALAYKIRNWSITHVFNRKRTTKARETK